MTADAPRSARTLAIGGGAFRLSGGLALIHSEMALVSSPGGTLGSNELTPYVGVGWGNPLRRGSAWSFVVDVGAFHGGGLSYSTASGAEGVSTAGARADDSGQLKLTSSWRPVFSTGIAFRF